MRVGLRGVELLQQHLAGGSTPDRRPGRSRRSWYFSTRFIADVAGSPTGDDIGGCLLIGPERDPMPDATDRIEHGALAVR